MTTLTIPDQHIVIDEFPRIQQELSTRGIDIDRWDPAPSTTTMTNQDEILEAYASQLKPFMSRKGYQAADVIAVNKDTPGIAEIRQKFLSEHTHSEDEVRYFIEGQGLFWFNIDNVVLSVLCTAGDLINVPAQTRHWFDLGPEPHVKAIRIFTNPEGWVAQYTGSGIDERYNPSYL
jgi:1,2-dihydroxy-3-keto-5-methylthiopentene dioxygenase